MHLSAWILFSLLFLASILSLQTMLLLEIFENNDLYFLATTLIIKTQSKEIGYKTSLNIKSYLFFKKILNLFETFRF